MTVREATEADLPILEELVLAYLDEHWARPYPPPPPGPYVSQGRIVVAEANGEVVGMAKGELREGLGHVSFVYLKPEARGQGRRQRARSRPGRRTSASRASPTSR